MKVENLFCETNFLNLSSFFYIQQRVPFAVIGSNTLLDVNGKKVRCRKYPWGIVEGE